jgi:hypothetical protein
MSAEEHFVRASALYDVETGQRLDVGFGTFDADLEGGNGTLDEGVRG